jgi:hypothetical protein
MKLENPRVAALTFAFLAGCSSLITVNGKPLLEDQWASDETAVYARAPIDLKCPRPNITLAVLDNFGGNMHYASQVAARGCGKTAIYTRIDVRHGLTLSSVQGD